MTSLLLEKALVSDSNNRPNELPGLFVRSPLREQMRDPLSSDWNRGLAASGATSEELVSLIDFGQLNQTFTRFLDVVGLPACIIDLNGKVLASSPWQRLCMEFHRTDPRTLGRCLESDISLSRQMEEGKEYALYRCKNGLTDCATPIVVEGLHVANLFIGQFLLDEPDDEFFREQQRTFNFPQEEYDAALAEVPIVDEARLPAIIEFVGGIARLIAAQSLAEKRAVAARTDVERQVALRTAELQETNRELEAFSYSVSHDLKSPLNSLVGFADILKSRYADQLPPEGQEALEHVATSADRMGNLITDLLHFSQSRHSEMEVMPVDMNGLVSEVVEELRPGWEGRVLTVDVAPLPSTRGDWAMLHQVVTNVIGNAVKFTATRPHAAIRVEGESVGDKVVYRFIDNGVGFDRKNADRLFTVFQRFHPQSRFPGTGVGLALVKRIVTRHGGEVTVDAVPDGGTTVTVTLPTSA